MKAFNDNIKSILSVLIIIFVFILLNEILWLCYKEPTIVSSLLIGLFSLLTGVCGYYYGYSQGASKKDEAQALLTANSQSTTITPAP